jgi:hypothetical protein
LSKKVENRKVPLLIAIYFRLSAREAHWRYLACCQLGSLVKISHEIPMEYHGKSWDAMVIALFTRGKQKIPWGIPWKAMVRFSKPWDTHNTPWELWDAIGITLVTMRNPINPLGISWETIWCLTASHGIPTICHGNHMRRHGITLVARGNPINPWGIKWKTWCVTVSRGKPDKMSQYIWATTLMTPWEDSILRATN